MQKRMVVGASSAADLVIDDVTVSRIHAELEPTDEGLWVRDLSSRNGTFVGHMRVHAHVVCESATINLGAMTVAVDYDNAVSAPVELWPDDRFYELFGRSKTMRELFALLARVAPTDASILIHGETGTGKEVVARSIHGASSRARGPFVIVDCAALPENLLEAELFGHVKGAFTGAVQARVGAIESADGGTVFLDEIGEVPLSMQPKLLRVLEQRTVRRIGDPTHRPVDVRFITATHRDLLSMVSRGEFREDLYFRMCVLPVRVPPLRNRTDDIPLLVEHFSQGEELSPEFVNTLLGQPWRGNVRELRNFVERARALGEDRVRGLQVRSFDGESSSSTPAPRTRPTLPPQDALGVSADVDEHEDDGVGASAVDRRPMRLPHSRRPETGLATTLGVGPPRASSSPQAAAAPVLCEGDFKMFRERWIEHGEREYLRRMLARHARNVAALAREAGVDRTYIYRLMRKYGL